MGPCQSYIHIYIYNGQDIYIYIHIYIYIYINAFGMHWAPSKRIWPWLNALGLYMGRPAFKQRVAREGRLPDSQIGIGLLKE